MSLKEPHKIRVMKKLIVLIIYLFMFQYVSAQNDSIIFKYQIPNNILFLKNEVNLSNQNTILLDGIIERLNLYKGKSDYLIIIYIFYNPKEKPKYIYNRLETILNHFKTFGYNREQFVLKINKANKFYSTSSYSFNIIKICTDKS
ncbi:hypothetical protein [Empedobacter sp. GD03797]|uniref:hypothetical protein n=1 Tax=Empedobacter sp. GD03797 TaxID=2975382 RepID=UPI00244A99CE|nr:hypothetical protein [Empedobacter sp. GD03797]MDH1883236.1 hypothetical protein [Empedobacter sp. GD03797]